MKHYFILLALIFCPFLANAQSSYRWLDNEGHIVYGTNPPDTAKNVHSIKTRGLSRYSSDSMLQKMGWKNKLSNKIATNKQSVKSKVSNVAATLEEGEMKFELNEQKQITLCQVIVINKSTDKEAKEVSIAFEFIDGTLIPAIGPNSIPPNSSAEYNIPQELLPLNLKNKLGQIDDNSKGIPKPHTIIYGAEG